MRWKPRRQGPSEDEYEGLGGEVILRKGRDVPEGGRGCSGTRGSREIKLQKVDLTLGDLPSVPRSK